MKNTALSICLLILSGINLYSQDDSDNRSGNWTQFLHLESGFVYPAGTIKESIAIRQNISSYYVNQTSTGEISSETFGFNLGLRWEYFNLKYKSGISSGLRYTGYKSDITGFSSSNADFFYLRYSTLNSDTKFARVKNINDVSNYLSIPLEIRIVPLQYKKLGLFAKAGTEFSRFNLKKKTNIIFQDEDMNVHEDMILSYITEPTNKFYSTLYASVGLQIGNENKPNFLFEVFLPSYYLSKNNFALIDEGGFEGFRFSLQFPLN